MAIATRLWILKYIAICLLKSNLVAKLIFLDQLCEISPYLPRNSLEAYVPYAILRSIYSQYYSNSPSMPLALLSHTSPAVKHRLDDMDSGSLHGTDNKHRNVRRSGPLDYSSSRKVKLVIEGSTSGSTGRSPLTTVVCQTSALSN
ncbi:hypothetical protein OIU84_007385 [Salix udensis]|uniref:Uncharacterized protein n=1 Tax=Salix udensis TaxID=889485 RepID=A0AAD6JSR3_9ROSI|nr:hypothetical protein OIU84_007385 [Salix udensis]